MSKASLSYKDLSLQTIITNNHRCSEEVRAFSKKNRSKLPLYSSSSKVFKDNVGKTYEDAVAFGMKKTNEKDPAYKTTIGAQFEYNRFTRDFSKIQIIKGKQKLMRLLLGTK